MYTGEFKVGERIYANEQADSKYSITNARNGFEGIVLECGYNDEYDGEKDPKRLILVKCERFSNFEMCREIGQQFWVEDKYFNSAYELKLQNVCVNDLFNLLEG